jgi:hypothetical protein
MRPSFRHAKASISAEADATLHVGEAKMVLRLTDAAGVSCVPGSTEILQI